MLLAWADFQSGAGQASWMANDELKPLPPSQKCRKAPFQFALSDEIFNVQGIKELACLKEVTFDSGVKVGADED